MKDIQQLIKKNSQEGRYEDIFPKTFIDAVLDKESGVTLTDILAMFNMLFLSYNSSRSQTRLQVPSSLRREGLWITYVLYDKTVVTEWYSAEAIDDATFGDSANWRDGSNALVGDISISSDGYWVINGEVTNIKAQGESGITPILRVGSNNHLQVSYTNGSSYVDVSSNPVFTQFRVSNNKLQQSTDLGESWSNISEELAYKFRESGNKIQMSKDLGNTWEDVSDYIAAWFRFTGTTGSSQADNVGKIQISRDNGATWSDLSGEFTNSLHIKGYVATVGTLPSTAVQGDIYGVGPTYDPSDTEHTNPIYQLYVKDSTGWVNNGRFTSISAGVVQELGNSETAIVSQKTITEEVNNLKATDEINLGKVLDLGNLLDLSTIDYTRYYSVDNNDIRPNTGVDDGIVAIPVQEGQIYSLGHGVGAGKFFKNSYYQGAPGEAITLLTNNNNEPYFIVPSGYNIAVLNVLINESHTAPLYTDGMICNSMYIPKTYLPYINDGKIKESKLPDNLLGGNVPDKLIVVGKNLFNKENIQLNRRLTTLDNVVGELISNDTFPNIVSSDYIRVEAGTYTLSGAGFQLYNGAPRVCFFTSKEQVKNAPILNILRKPDLTYTFTVPSKGYIIFDSLLDKVQYNQLEIGQVATKYESYRVSINPDLLESYAQEDEVFITDSKNKLNPADILYDRRYSTGSKEIIVADPNLIALGTLFPVKEGQWYVAWGEGIFQGDQGYQGGYFYTNENLVGTPSIENITFVQPVSGPGMAFQVPTGKGIKYATVSLATNSDHTALAGQAMVEEGELATVYEDYNPKKVFNPEYSTNSSTAPSPTDSSELLKYTTFGNLSYSNLSDKLEVFFQHWRDKDKDLCVVNTGTSLTARSSEHCTEHPLASSRPPLMQSNNFATHIWDALKWEGQEYRRYDYENATLEKFFIETGTGWNTETNLSNWDDGPYRYGLTRYTDDLNSSIQFKIPAAAWKYNFIYRTDSLGSENCKITIAGGNGLVEVLDETTNTWKEANNFIFSMKEAPVRSIPSITYKDPNTNTSVTLNNYQVKGNTTYQKRLYMRCKSSTIDSRNSEKTVLISRSTGRLMYWGVEWSPREFMITYINAARGSHSSIINSNLSLCHFMDNEVFSFKPDLMLTEDPIHNSGGGGTLSPLLNTWYYGNTTEQFFFADNGVSIKARAQALGLNVPLFCIFNTTITWNFGAINDDGTLKVASTADGRMWTALDAQMSCYSLVKNMQTEIVYINAIKHWKDACIACYGNMRAATIGSGKDGKTFTNEGSHWNDTGCRVMARVVLPILESFV